MEKLGIDNLKSAIKAAIKLGEKIESNLEDGKITLAEALGTGVTSFGDVVKLIKNGSQIKAEFIDLDQNERDELTELVKDELDLNNDRVEYIIETAVEFLFRLEDLIKAMK